MPRRDPLKRVEYKVRRAPRMPKDLRRIRTATGTDFLTGEVQGQSASDLEERWAKSAYRFKVPFSFQPSFIAGRNVPGEIRLDFMMIIASAILQPVQIDGKFAHRATKERDRINDARLNDALKGTGAQAVIRITEERLSNQDVTDRTFKEVVLNQ